jgi:hypothetical protein
MCRVDADIVSAVAGKTENFAGIHGPGVISRNLRVTPFLDYPPQYAITLVTRQDAHCGVNSMQRGMAIGH